MKIQIKTSIVPMTRFGRIVSFLARSGKAIEGHFGELSANFSLLEGEPRDINLSSVLLGAANPISYDELINLNFSEEESHTWAFTFPNAGMSEFRIYLANLADEDVLIDDVGNKLFLKSGETRYYTYNFRIYSFYDLFLFFFALISGIGAIFEILNFLCK